MKAVHRTDEAAQVLGATLGCGADDVAGPVVATGAGEPDGLTDDGAALIDADAAALAAALGPALSTGPTLGMGLAAELAAGELERVGPNVQPAPAWLV